MLNLCIGSTRTISNTAILSVISFKQCEMKVSKLKVHDYMYTFLQQVIMGYNDSLTTGYNL